ncbi:DgyrCDS7564 [Dimorphilus gyrociliatus]|uniref:DgyrCDS7564 n=1 Tax=Dimorphilus gyrociliatus TaxID=2664684 RepID=A0A7I8VRE9_9ANNE|nr:DgyrCDS7564 [Dimorphilus gyrociliatus]
MDDSAKEKMMSDGDSIKENEPKKKLRNVSQKSTDSSCSSKRRSSRSSLYRRVSSTETTDKPFDRTASKISSVASKGSLQVTRSEYHDNLKPELASGITLNLCVTAFVIVFGSSFLFGYNIGALNQISPLIKSFYNETYVERNNQPISDASLTFLWSLTTALFLPGGMIGAFSAGFIADKIGRKKAILLSYIFAILGAIISTFPVISRTPELLMVGRVLVGVHSGLSTSLAPMYLSEICPFNYRGAFGTLHQLFITIGILAASIFGIEGILGTEKLWPYVLSINAIPPLLCLAILPFLPESPRYLLLIKNERELASKALRFFRNRKDITTDIEEMDTEQSDSKSTKTEVYTLKKLFLNPALRMPLLIACCLQVVQQFSGINAIFFYSNGIFNEAGVSANHIPYAVIGTNAVNVLMTIIAIPIMDIAGRRALLLYPMIVMIFDLAIITVAQNFQKKAEWLSIVAVVCVIIYVIGFAVGLGPIPQMIGAELFRQGPRPLAMSLAGFVNWLGTFIIAISFESIQKELKHFTFLLFLGLMVLFLIFVYCLVPETRNKTFEEIAHQFAPGANIEVEEFPEVFDEDPLPEPDQSEDHRLVSFTVGESNKTTECATNL